MDALLLSLKEHQRRKHQRRIETQYLMLRYQPNCRWAEPPPMRPWSEQ